jgi:hypothetical protein
MDIMDCIIFGRDNESGKYLIYVPKIVKEVCFPEGYEFILHYQREGLI